MGVCPYPLPSFEDGDAQLATVLRDNGTNALALGGLRERDL
jgi:hypothetical protein